MGRNLTNLPISASFQYLTQISGSELTDGLGNDIDSLNISASYATLAGTSGFADVATSASFADQSGTSGFATTALSASFATTASYALNQTDTTYDLDSIQVGSDVAITLVGSDASLDTVTLVAGTDITLTDDGSSNITIDASVPSFDTGSLLVTGSITDATITLEKGDGSTFPLTVDNVTNATSASYAVTAETASFLPSDTNLNINSITASFASFTSASIGYLQTVTGSATIIGDAFIILNNDTPTQRYAGIVVQDSGSTAATASLFFDGVTNDWNYEYTSSGDPDNFGVVMFGPEYNTKGSPIYPTLNTIQKGGGGHHLLDSNITDDGTTTSVSERFETANGNASGINSTATGNGNTASGNQASAIGGFNNNASGVQAFIAGGGLSSVTQQRGAVIGGYQHIVGAEDSVIIGGFNSDVLATHARSVVLGGTALATTKADEVVVPHLTISGSTIATDISASGFVSASTFIGDGSQLTGISTNPTLQEVTDNGATTTNAISIDGRTYSSTGITSATSGVTYTVRGGTNTAQLLLNGNDNTATNSITLKPVATDADNIFIQGDTKIDDNLYVVGDITGSNASITGTLSIYGDTFISSSVLGTGSLIDNLGQEAIVTGSQVQHIVNLSQAEYDALTPDVNTLYVIDGAETLGDTVISGSLIGEVGVLTDAAGTTTLDCSTGNYFTLAMPAGGTTALTPTNIQIGQTINIKITQNATASTLTYAASIDFPGGTAFTISTGSGEVDILTLVSFDGTSLQATGLANFS